MEKNMKILVFVTLSSLMIVSSCVKNINVNSSVAIGQLVFKTNGGGVRPYYGLFIAQYLGNIGIDIEVKVEEWTVFVGTLLLTHDYDIGIVALVPDYLTPDMRHVYTTNGTLNMFDLGPDIPYNNESEAMQNSAFSTTDLDVCKQIYYGWQQLMMDKIVPMLPLYSGKYYSAYWSNIIIYDSNWGFMANLPYMHFDGYHEGQVSLDELNFVGSDYTELNPLFNEQEDSKFIWNLESESIILIHDSKPRKDGIVNDWERINETHYTFTIRDNVYWNPSYNITKRTINSAPLSDTPTGELMVGLKNAEYSDGTNQQVTAKDAVFTLLAHANPITSGDTYAFHWIKACYVDPEDDMTFHIEIDQIPATPEHEFYSSFWYFMNVDILPEFFLNSSDPTITYTEGGGVECSGLYDGIKNTPQWQTFSFSPFGCGMYMLDYYMKGSTIVLKRSPYWFGVGAIDGQEGMTPLVETINLRIIGDDTSIKFEFLAGRLDSCGLDKVTYNQLVGDPRFHVAMGEGGNLIFIFYNLRRPFIGKQANYEFLDTPGKEEYTKGVAIRKAMNYAINRVEMNEVVNEGDCLIVDSVLYICFPDYYNYNIIKYDYNLTASYEWLCAAGYSQYCTTTTTTTTIDTTKSTLMMVLVVSLIIPSLYTFRRKRN